MKDLTGETYGRLVVVRLDFMRKGRAFWLCQCECGKLKAVSAGHLAHGTKSCGCLSVEKLVNRSVTHGLRRIPEYAIHNGIMRRCYNPKAPRYADYGGRGITVCNRWHDPTNFVEDIAKMPKLQGQSLDRIDNDGPYSPENCRFASVGTQRRNSRRVITFTHEGVTHVLKDWAAIRGLKYMTVYHRVKTSKWPIASALEFQPPPAGSGRWPE